VAIGLQRRSDRADFLHLPAGLPIHRVGEQPLDLGPLGRIDLAQCMGGEPGVE
jgi:hypothetical protein